MATSVRIVDRDNGYRKLFVELFGLAQQPRVAVGVFEADGGIDVGGKTVIEIATWNEFGTSDGHVPSRAFLRGWFDENSDKAREAMAVLLRQVLEGKHTKEQALNKFGLWVQGKIQERIAKGINPPNAESTVRKKGSSKPLIDTGVLRSSITYAVSFDGEDFKPVKSEAKKGREKADRAKVRDAAKAEKTASRERAKERKAIRKDLNKKIDKALVTAKKSVKKTIKSKVTAAKKAIRKARRS